MKRAESAGPAGKTGAQAQRRAVAAEDVYTALREMILNFELYPGTRVTETELAELFEVSRTPVREALLRLENEGHLTIRSKQGCFIRQIDIEELSEYYRVRTALELAVVEDACTRMPTKEVEGLLEQWSPEKTPKKIRSSAMEERDEAFHTALALGTGNTILLKYLRDINDHIRVIRRVEFHNPERVARTYKEHHGILLAILQREVDKARNLMKRHIERSEQAAQTLTLTQLARKKSFAQQLRAPRRER